MVKYVVSTKQRKNEGKDQIFIITLSANINLHFHLLVRVFYLTLQNCTISLGALAFFRMNKGLRKHLCLYPVLFFSLKLSVLLVFKPFLLGAHSRPGIIGLSFQVLCQHSSTEACRVVLQLQDCTNNGNVICISGVMTTNSS